MRKINILIYGLIGLFLFSMAACNKDSIEKETTIDINEPTVIVDTEITGRVADINDEAIGGATIIVGNQQTLSDENGVFQIKTPVNEKRATIKVTKEGYFNAFPVITPSKVSAKFVKIKMTAREVVTSFSTTQGGTAALDNGTQVVFAANSFIDQSGQAYAGTVNIFATYIDPTADNLYEIMPGNLTAMNTENNIVGLKSFGMLNLELEDDAGNALQINQNATITVRVPDELLSQAPASIPLWYFDENSGLWIEEGSATLQGNAYVGEVAHFTPWNCDDPFTVIDLSGQVLINTNPTNTVYVRITRISDGSYGSFLLDNLGNFADLVPLDEPLQLEVIDECDEVIHSENIGPFSTDTQLETINVTVDDDIYSLISGIIVDCDGNAVSNGYVKLNFVGSKTYFLHADESGTFSDLVANCNASTVLVTAVNIDGFVGGDEEVFSISETINIGNITACGNDLGSDSIPWAIFIMGEESYETPHCQVEIDTFSGDYYYEYNMVASVDSLSGVPEGTFMFYFELEDFGDGDFELDEPILYYLVDSTQEVFLLYLDEWLIPESDFMNIPGYPLYFKIENVTLSNFSQPDETIHFDSIELRAFHP